MEELQTIQERMGNSTVSKASIDATPMICAFVGAFDYGNYIEAFLRRCE